MKTTKILNYNNFLIEAEEEPKQKGTYAQFVEKMLKKYNVESPSQLSKEDKTKFYNDIDAGWESEAEKKGNDPDDKKKESAPEKKSE